MTADDSGIRAPRTAPSWRARFAGSAIYCAGLLPVSVGALAAVLVGRPDTAGAWSHRWQRRLGGNAPDIRRGAPAAGNAVTGVLLGLLALIPIGLEVLFVARGVLYPVVDRGPYDTSWGGPSWTGAWAAHFAVGAGFAVAGVFMLIGIAALHRRWGLLLAGERVGWWVVPVTALAGAAGTAFFVAWLHQI